MCDQLYGTRLRGLGHRYITVTDHRLLFPRPPQIGPSDWLLAVADHGICRKRGCTTTKYRGAFWHFGCWPWCFSERKLQPGSILKQRQTCKVAFFAVVLRSFAGNYFSDAHLNVRDGRSTWRRLYPGKTSKYGECPHCCNRACSTPTTKRLAPAIPLKDNKVMTYSTAANAGRIDGVRRRAIGLQHERSHRTHYAI